LSIFVPGINKTAIENESTVRKIEEHEEEIQKKFCNLNKYMEKLIQERKDWHQEYQNRKSQRKNLIKQKASTEIQGQILDLNLLTESDRAFLRNRPNYENYWKNNRELLHMTTKISMLSERVNNATEKFMKNMQDSISRTGKKLIKISEQ